MITQTNSAMFRNAYSNNLSESRDIRGKATNITKQGDTSKVEQIKDAISSGEYRIDLQALSEKIAEELL